MDRRRRGFRPSATALQCCCADVECFGSNNKSKRIVGHQFDDYTFFESLKLVLGAKLIHSSPTIPSIIISNIRIIIEITTKNPNSPSYPSLKSIITNLP
ncbi:hypothetical protein Hdeb2414_s0032g00711241 [Helianthus debilis subsp. tardiflorus]